jgi:hypothetical protein
MRSIRATGSLVALAGLVAAASATGAAASPYAPLGQVESSTTNVYAGCPPDSSGVNFPNSEVEPWVDVNPTNQDNFVAIWQQDRYSNGGSKSNAAGVTFDAGASWTQVAIPQNTRCTGGRYQRASDPWVTFSPNGAAHAMSLVTDPDLPTGAFGANGMVANRSTNGGLTWSGPKQLIADEAGRFLNDKNSMTADPNDSRFVYAVWDRLQVAGSDINAPAENRRGLGFKGPVYFTRSTNNGVSYEAPRKILETGANKQTIGNQIVVEPASRGGSLFDFFDDITNSSNRLKGLGPLKFAFIRSDDNGRTWTNPRRADDMLPMALFRFSGVIDPESPPAPCPQPDPQGNCPIRAADLIPEVAVNRSNGALYGVWQDARFDGFTHDDVAFTQSTDGGNGWSAPIKVNLTPPDADPDNEQAFTPSVHVADDGTIAVSYFDYRNNTPADGILGTDHWVVHCHPSSENCASPASWNEESRASTTTFDMRRAPFARGWFVGDYMGLASRNNEFVSTFGSTDGNGPSSIFTNRLIP